MASDSFGIGIVSCGFITQEAHAPSIGYLPGAELAAVQNRTRATAEDLAERSREEGWGDPTVYGEGQFADLVADPAVDGVWVTSPNFLRADVVDAVVDAVEDGADIDGIALEKPIARTVDEGRHILSRVEGAGLSHAYLENWPHEPGISKMRDLLWSQGRSAGRPYLARAQAEHGGPHSAWFWDGRKQGGGALTDMLCHSLAGNHVLLSDPATAEDDIEPVSISADTATLKWSQDAYAEQLAEEHGIDFAARPVDDYARVTIRYADADGETVMSEATGSWCYVGAGVKRSIELLGPEYSGQIVTDEESSSVFFSDDLGDGEGWAEKQTATSGRLPVAAAFEVEEGFVAENRDAVAAFRAGEHGMLDLADGLQVLEICMAAYKAAEEGREITFDAVDLSGYVPEVARD